MLLLLLKCFSPRDSSRVHERRSFATRRTSLQKHNGCSLFQGPPFRSIQKVTDSWLVLNPSEALGLLNSNGNSVAACRQGCRGSSLLLQEFSRSLQACYTG